MKNDSANAKMIIMAAGKGTRLHSEQHRMPKVLREAAGQPLLLRILDRVSFLKKENIVIIVGYKGELVEQAAGPDYRYAWQREQLGTGHAVMQAVPELAGYDGPVMVGSGDMPLITRETYKGMLDAHINEGNACTMLAYVSDKDMRFGRIVRDETGAFEQVVEDGDCTPEQKKITELNAGVYVFDAQTLVEGLSQLSTDNAQNEYYLTDVPSWIQRRGGKIGIFRTKGEYEGLGVNTQEDLDLVSRVLSEED